MLKIHIHNFNLENVLEMLRYDDGYERTWEDNLGYEAIEGGYGLSFVVNGKSIIDDNIAYILNATLRSINNAVFKILTVSSEAEVNIEAGSGAPPCIIKLRKENSKIFFTTLKERWFIAELDDEPCDLVQAVEEVIQVVKIYHDTFLQAANITASDNVEEFMEIIYRKKIGFNDEEHKKLYIEQWHPYDPQRFPYDPSKELTICHYVEPWRENKVREDLERKDPTKQYLFAPDDQLFLPLETAWKEYKEKHGITDSEVKRVMDQAEKEYAVFEKESRKITELLTKTKGIKGSEYKKVQGKVYWNFIEIEHADYETFQVLARFYAKDKESVYYLSMQIASADSQTFEILSENYSKDKNHVFADDDIIKEADPKTFKVLDGRFAIKWSALSRQYLVSNLV